MLPGPRGAAQWERFIFARKDAPGLTHYLGFGDVNGDGRPDAATGAKGGPHATPGTGDYFAWWEAPADPTQVREKHLVAKDQSGATNIHPADVNGDGKVDFIVSRGHGRGIVWFESPNWQEHIIHATMKEPHCLVVIDFDGDGDIDAATATNSRRGSRTTDKEISRHISSAETRSRTIFELLISTWMATWIF